MLPLGEWIQQLLTEFLGYIKPWVLIDQYEMGVLLRFGKFHKVLNPGLHPKIPIVDYGHAAITTFDTLSIDEVNLTTADGQTISIGLYVEFEVDDIYKYLILTNDTRTNMVDISKGVLSSVLEDITWEDIKKKVTINAIKRRLTPKFAEMGVLLKDCQFTDKCKSRVFKVFSGGALSLQNKNVTL